MFARRLPMSKIFGAIFILIILHFMVKRNVKNSNAESFKFNEKSLFGKTVEFYSNDELRPAIIRRKQDRIYPGKGGKPVILTSSGDGLEYRGAGKSQICSKSHMLFAYSQI